MKTPPICHPIRYLLFALFAVAPLTSQAVFLSFEDLEQYDLDNPLHDPPENTAPNPVTNQYASLGVIFDGAGVSVNSDGIKTGTQGIADSYGPDMSIRFVGDLPSYVSFYLSAVFEDKLFMSVFDETGGLITETTSDGWFGVEENSQPYTSLQFFEFSGTPIGEVRLSSFYNRRSDILLDDLTFTSAQSVPEPSSLLIAASALLGLCASSIYRCRSRRQTLPT